MNRRFLLLIPLALTASLAQAAGMKIENAWARPTVPGLDVGVVYLRIDNRGGKADRLLSIRTPVATGAAVHRTIIENDIARMRPVSVLHVGANEVVMLEPSGLHIMLFGLKKPLVKDQSFPLELVFEVSGKVKATVTVREG